LLNRRNSIFGRKRGKKSTAQETTRSDVLGERGPQPGGKGENLGGRGIHMEGDGGRLLVRRKIQQEKKDCRRETLQAKPIKRNEEPRWGGPVSKKSSDASNREGRDTPSAAVMPGVIIFGFRADKENKKNKLCFL